MLHFKNQLTMKKMKYIVMLLCAVLLTSTSCDSFLDITPDGQVKRDPLLSTPEGIEDAMYGVYSQMRTQSLYVRNCISQHWKYSHTHCGATVATV